MLTTLKNYLMRAFLTGLSVVAMVFFVALLIYPSLPNIDRLSEYRPKQPLQIFSSDGALIAEFGEERREYTSINTVPQKMINAIIAIEDRRFFEHPGFDIIGVIRAALKNLTGQSHEGASTITMQVARNFFLSSEKTLKRKINEVLLAIKIERNLSKEEILGLYINQIYLGQRSFGFSAAADTYFDKSLSELNLAETALLAGLPKAPSRYNPFVNPDRAIKRQQAVLFSMKRHGFIDNPTYILALEEPLNLRDSAQKRELRADYIAEMVRKTLYAELGEKIYTSGLKVYTTLKKKNQRVAKQAVKNGIISYISRHELLPNENFIDLDEKSFQDDKEKKQYLVNKLRLIPTYNNFIPGVVLEIQPQKVVALLKNGKKISVFQRGLTLLKADLKKENIDEKNYQAWLCYSFCKKLWEMDRHPTSRS